MSLREIANRELRCGDPRKGVLFYALDAVQGNQFPELSEFWLDLARRKWLRSRKDKKPEVAICCWSLSHNPAGRAITLAEAYRPHANVKILGTMMPGYGGEIWEPIRSSSFEYDFFVVSSEKDLVRDAFELVIRHPCDVVHLSKPRIHNVIFGWLYQLIWGARVIMDVDDEELAFVGADSPLDPYEYTGKYGSLPQLHLLREKTWTQLAVGMVNQFDGITVSNNALRQRYGGVVLPHVRPVNRFRPSKARKFASRREFSVPLDKQVVLFFGTPRKHKGIAETARALEALGRADICYVIAGGQPDAALRNELDVISGVEIIILSEQPYERAPDVIALGDVCVLLQDADTLVAQFQFPAKLIDALGMGLTVFAQVTPPLENLVRKGVIIPVTPNNVSEKLNTFFNRPNLISAVKGRAVFEMELSVEAVAPVIKDILLDESPRRANHLNWNGQLERLLNPGMLPLGVPIAEC